MSGRILHLDRSEIVAGKPIRQSISLVQDFQQSWRGLGVAVSQKSMRDHAGPMTQQQPKRDRLVRPLGIQAPVLEVAVHVLVEVELAGLLEFQDGQRRHRLADRGDLELRVGVHGQPLADVTPAETLRPDDLAAIDHGHGDARDAFLTHRVAYDLGRCARVRSSWMPTAAEAGIGCFNARLTWQPELRKDGQRTSRRHFSLTSPWFAQVFNCGGFAGPLPGSLDLAVEQQVDSRRSSAGSLVWTKKVCGWAMGCLPDREMTEQFGRSPKVAAARDLTVVSNAATDLPAENRRRQGSRTDADRLRHGEAVRGAAHHDQIDAL